MKSIIEQFVTFFLILIMLWVGITFMMMNVIHGKARDFHSAVVTRVQDSNFSGAVITECVKKAKEKGYDMNIRTKQTGMGNDGEVILRYHFVIPLTKQDKEFTIEGFAR